MTKEKITYTFKELKYEYERGKAEAIKKITKIKKWLKSIVWCNGHDTTWIEQTITKLRGLQEELK